MSLFMSACVVGGALGQWPIGRLSDRVDRRWVILALCLASAAAGLLLAFVVDAPDAVLLLLAVLFGASALTIYAICVAYANDRADPASFVEVSSHLLLAFGVGAIIGPFTAGILLSEAGISSLFLFTAGIDVILALLVVFRIRTSEPVPEPERAIFAPHPPISHGTQVIVELQPSESQAEQVQETHDA